MYNYFDSWSNKALKEYIYIMSDAATQYYDPHARSNKYYLLLARMAMIKKKKMKENK